MGFFRKCRDRRAVDENQRRYRERFGIVDRYLLQYSIDDENGRNNSYIIFIDYEYAIDWVDNRDKSTWSEADRNRFNAYTARLELIQSRPIFNLTNYEKLAYKVMLGAAYIQVFQCQFDEVDNTIAAAECFYNKRNSENARKFCLNYSGLVTFVGILLMLCIHTLDVLNHPCFIGTFTVFMGVLGAYVSIWGRYTRYALEGVSSKWLYVIESLSRLLIGGIFAFVALLAVKCGIAFSFINTNIETYAYGLCGFVSGLSERFIPSLVERIANENH